MENLIKILEGFEKRRNDRNKEEWEKKSLVAKYEEIANWFKPCAEQILCNGYFLVNDEYIIDLGAIELYYHEEEGKIKDPIMYHTNGHQSKSKIFKLKNKDFPYFKFGSFNLHQSGVDVTFENPNEKYRASFLIRSYRIVEKKKIAEIKLNRIPFDDYSTHIFDDMFYNGILLSDNSITIKWKEYKDEFKKGGSVNLEWRKNVAMYREDGNKYEKVTKEYYEKNKAKFDSQILNPQYFKPGKVEYLKENRLWQFKWDPSGSDVLQISL